MSFFEVLYCCSFPLFRFFGTLFIQFDRRVFLVCPLLLFFGLLSFFWARYAFRNSRISSMFQDILPVLQVMGVSNNTLVSAGSLLQNLSQSMSGVTCGRGGEVESCRDESTALIFKLIAIASIFVAGLCGIAIPLVGKKRKFLGTDSNLFVVAKAFAAGVILATGFVHILPDATTALTDPCLPESPWRKFPFSGFIAMMAALGTLLVEFVATQYYERKQEKQSEIVRVNSAASLDSGIIPSVDGIGTSPAVRVFGDEEGGAMHIVGIHAHAAHHRHSHSQEQGACAGNMGGHEHGHSHPHVASGLDDESGKRHVVVSQVLELGILSHSVIIGLSLGLSQSPCTIRPLIGALTFHQFFEGFALGGCISQAQFKTLHSTLMASFFAVTTPFGVALGIALSKSYNANSPRAVAIEGIFDSISAGILVYMALVDLIAADFLSKRMSCNARLQVVSYIALFLGAGLMSLLAIWA